MFVLPFCIFLLILHSSAAVFDLLPQMLLIFLAETDVSRNDNYVFLK
jgi:hypothetical protein